MDELRSALELATDDELQDLTEILFQRKFNPIDYLYSPDPAAVLSLSRHDWLDTLERRFRFLAADGLTVLKGQAEVLSYRQILFQVARHLKIRPSPSLSTTDLEAEIFLSLMQRTWKQLPRSEQEQIIEQVRQSLEKSHTAPLPLHCQPDSLRLLLEGGSALAVSALVSPWVLRQIAQQFALHFAAYQMARQASHLSSQVLLATARKGMVVNAARFGMARSAFVLLGSALWMGFLADLGWRTIASNYGRIIPIIFTLAQIRLTRAECLRFA
ncbi:hypothetical protein GS597_05745 [Synechococcales cyanobacterium C]|uniref:Uncharacterized protein n=1 Tax=Petrachloros mirabilis ULC683 TaxID=2781853 RepID=A0A8K1ZY42_9CYAN|nr:hypothetical protein [Petrachloros mirabilis]NCJ06023.1 hypothetical protein [Petrachloros mirabilis ULC683]